jgi:hypothetical protein
MLFFFRIKKNKKFNKMENITTDQISIFLSDRKTSWLQEILNLCTIVPLGLVGTVLNLISLRIFF